MQFDYAHDGGKCPIDGNEIVMVEFRNGMTSNEPIAASKWRWAICAEGEHDFDIISYSITGKPKNDGGTWTAVSGGYA
jgi:hypothetical protein